MIYGLNRLVPRWCLRRIAPVWVICLVAGSLLPGRAKMVIGSTRLRDQGHAAVGVANGEWKHRTFHIVGFGATTLLFMGLARNQKENVIAAVSVFSLGAALEWLQMWMYSNSLEREDIRDDGYGVALMFAVALLWHLTASGIAQNRRNEERSGVRG